MSARLILIVLATAALAGLGACKPQEKADAPLDPKEQLARGLTVCPEGSEGFPETLCKNEALAALGADVSETLVAEAAGVSDAGAQLLVQGQQRWLEAQRVACGVIDPEGDLTDEQRNCLAGALRARAQAARQVVEEVGGRRFQTVEVIGAQAVTAEAAAAAGLGGDDAPTAVMRDIKYPRIDGDASPQAQRFNELVMQQPQFRLEDQTEEVVNYKIVYAGPDIISVKFETYDNTLGAVHPNQNLKAVTVLMTGEGRPLAVSDVFRAGSNWERFVTRRAVETLTRQFRADGFAPPERDVREAATKPHLWLISEQGLTILFPPYSFGGPHVLGGTEVLIPWTDLATYLNPQAPQPIRPAA
jgi:hypothetical protein